MLIGLAGFQIHLYKAEMQKPPQHNSFSRFSTNTYKNLF